MRDAVENGLAAAVSVPVWASWKTLVSIAAYHSFGGEVEARTPPRYAAYPFMPSPTFAHSSLVDAEVVVDEVRCHADQREPLAALPDHLMAGRMRDQVSKSLHGNRIAVAEHLLDRLGERQKTRHSQAFLEG